MKIFKKVNSNSRTGFKGQEQINVQCHTKLNHLISQKARTWILSLKTPFEILVGQACETRSTLFIDLDRVDARIAIESGTNNWSHSYQLWKFIQPFKSSLIITNFYRFEAVSRLPVSKLYTQGWEKLPDNTHLIVQLSQFSKSIIKRLFK